MTRIDLFVLALLLAAPGAARPDAPSRDLAFTLELEGGPLWQSRNDAQIPADTGTRFSVRAFDAGPFAAWRAYAGARLGRHELRGLVAPFEVELDGSLPKAVRFQEDTFDAGVPTTATYRFDSYRLTYRYALVDRAAWTLKVGLTGKIRDAEIALAQAGRSARRANTGFVPLLHVAATWRFAPAWELILDADALAAPQGRAEDVALLVGWSPWQRVQLRAGYRTVEGGSDGGGDVYSFAWLHQAVAGVKLEL